MNRLLNIGFYPVGTWEIDNNNLNLNLVSDQETKDLIYSFIIDGTPKYIGITKNKLVSRLNQYLNPHLSQSTNLRVNQLLIESLNQNHTIEIFIYKNTSLLKLGDFDINLAIGLEASLIKFYNAEWNIRERRIEILVDDIENNEIIQNNAIDQDNTIINENPIHEIRFSINLVQSYFSNGFINIPREYSELFGEDGQELILNFSGDQKLTRIARRINNGLPRIYIGVDFKNWLITNYNVGDVLHLTKIGNILNINN